MEEIIYEFDRMRPTVRLEVRSKKNKNLGVDQAPFVNTPITAADVLLDPSLAPPGTLPPEVGYSGQRIHNSFAIPDPRTGVLIPFMMIKLLTAILQFEDNQQVQTLK